ncbi:MAG: hypothetical protein AAB634_00645 [Patescibacteria group bacterium]
MPTFPIQPREVFLSLKRGFRPGSPLFYITLATCFAVLLILLSYIFSQRKFTAELPQEFLDARKDASAVSKEIVALTSSVNEAVRALNLLDVAEQKPKALQVVNQAKTDTKSASSRAFELSRHLERMTKSLASLSSGSAQRLAYTAIATELSLVSEFLTYTENLNAFLASVERSFAARSTKEEQEAISKALDEVNKSAKTINRLNDDFLSKMKRFDTSL